MNIKQMGINEVIPYGKNPRKNDNAVDKVANSIREFGFQQPVIVDKDNVIICGHTRLKAAKKLKLKTIPVVVAEKLTPEQAKAYRIADNKTNEFAEWDNDLLTAELMELNDLDIDMDVLGFDVDELTSLMYGEEGGTAGQTDPDEVPETPEKPKSKLGKVYQLGNHRLMCGDSTDTEQVSKLMKGEKADMVFTDPPYGVSYESSDEDFEIIKNDKLRGDSLQKFLTLAFKNIFIHTIKEPALYIWHASRTQIQFETAINKSGFDVKQQIIWNKGMTLSRSDYHWAHEPCFYCKKTDSRTNWYGDRTFKTVINQSIPDLTKLKKEDFIQIFKNINEGTTNWEIKRDGVSTYEHPTQKPTSLAIRAIKNSSLAKHKVLDLFLGSGSTLIACEQTDRVCFGMELDEHYCDVIRKRWAEFVHGKECDWIKLTPEAK
jgi:DNA modification methylase